MPPRVSGDPAKTLTEALQKRFAKASIRQLSDGADSALKEVIPTGIDVLDDWSFGVGGLPVGRVMELFADPGAGKTSLLFHFMGAAQRVGGMSILCESENTLMPERSPVFGVDTAKVVLSEPPTIEDLIEQLRAVLELIPKGEGPNIIGWDSLAASPSQNIADGEKSRPGQKARLMSEQLPVITKLLIQKRTVLVIVNQTRNKIGIAFGNPTTTPGGETLKFLASLRLQLWRGKSIKQGEEAVGQYVTTRCMKNKIAMPLRKAKLRLNFETGWDNEWSTLDFAKTEGLIAKDAKGPEAYAEAVEKLQQKMGGWYVKKS